MASIYEGIVYLMVSSYAGMIQKKKKILCGDNNGLIYSFLNRDHCIGINTLQIHDKYFDASS